LARLFPDSTVKRLTAAAAFAQQPTTQRHCARTPLVVLFLPAGEARPQQSERVHDFERGPALYGGAKFGMVY
jgi:hypothetical protein